MPKSKSNGSTQSPTKKMNIPGRPRGQGQQEGNAPNKGMTDAERN